jgi:hypothetical protein
MLLAGLLGPPRSVPAVQCRGKPTTCTKTRPGGQGPVLRTSRAFSSHLQDDHLLPVAQDPEGKWVPGPKARGHLAAAQGDGVHVGPQVRAVLVEVQSVALEAAPAFLPALAHQHVQIACEGTGRRDLPTARPNPRRGGYCARLPQPVLPPVPFGNDSRNHSSLHTLGTTPGGKKSAGAP